MLADWRKFRADPNGSVAIVFGFALLAIVAAAAAAVDSARWFAARRQHAQAIDNAVIAGARVMQTDATNSAAAIAAATEFYRNNLPPNVDIVDNTVTFGLTDGGSSISYTGTAYIPTTFLKAIGYSKLEIAAPAKAVFAAGMNNGSNVEIALMLDTTGSMCADGIGPCGTSTKLDGVKAAASNLSAIVLNGAIGGYTSRVALVPFSASIRVAPDGQGDTLMRALTNMPLTASFTYTQCTAGTAGQVTGEIATGGTCTATATATATNWRLNPCVTDRGYNSSSTFDASDDAPGSGRWLNGQGGDRRPAGDDSSNAAASSINDVGWNYSPGGNGCAVGAGNSVVPLTSNLTTLTASIQSLSAYGPTAGALGTNWTQYVLSPSWASIFPASAKPGSYADTKTKQANGAPLLRKVAILMTDGVYNTMRQNPYQDVQQTSNNALAVCNNMKANGIEIFAVGFDLQALTATERSVATAMLQSCATDASHFYDSANANDLQMAFKDIAMKVTPIRLTQ